MGMENITARMERLAPDRVMVELGYKGEPLGIIYYEKPKKTWFKKPIMPNMWRAVDAKVERLFIQGEGEYTPLDLLTFAQKKVQEFIDLDISSQHQE